MVKYLNAFRRNNMPLTQNRKFILLLIIIALETVFLLYNLTSAAMWHDEAFSALLVKYDPGEMFYRIGLDVHPPFYYILLREWTLFSGNSLFSIRSFSLFFWVLTILAVYFFVKKSFGNKNLAFFSALLALFNSFFIQYAQEARMYTLGVFLIALSSYFLLRALEEKNKKWWFFYALAAGAAIYTHYYIFFSIAAQAIFILYWIIKESGLNFSLLLKNKNFRLGLGTYALIVLSYLPWLKTFFRQFSQVEKNYWIPPINLGSVPNTFYKMTAGIGIDGAKFWYVLILLTIVILAALIYSLRELRSPAKWLVFLLLVVPFLGAILLSFKTSIYLDRYFVFALPFYIILITAAILEIPNKWIRNTAVAIAVLGSLISFPLYWINLNVAQKPGMAGAAAYLNQKIKEGNKIYVGSSFIYFNFKFYNKTNVSPKLYTPAELAHFSGTALLSPEDIINNFDSGVKKNDIVWMLNTTGFGNYQPEVPKEWIKLDERGFQDVYDYRGWIIATKYIVP